MFTKNKANVNLKHEIPTYRVKNSRQFAIEYGMKGWSVNTAVGKQSQSTVYTRGLRQKKHFI